MLLGHLFAAIFFSVFVCGAHAGNISVERNFIWDEPNQLKADIFRPAEGANFPAVLLVHGGGWGAGDRSEMDWFGRRLAQEGWVAVSIDYRLVSLSKGILGDTALSDVRNAVRSIREHATTLHVDPQRIAILGGSAGGHLAAMVATDQDNLLRGAVMLWGPSDLTLARSALLPDQFGMISSLLGVDYSSERARLASPIWRISPSSAPHWLLLHGDADALVPVSQSRAFSAALMKSGIDAEYLELPGEGHGLRSPEAQERSAAAIVRFLKRIL